MNYKVFETTMYGDENGRLISFEKDVNCPFDVKRTFYIFDTKNDIVRGAHANKNSEFLLIAINGSCKIKLDDGKKQEIVELTNPYTALYIGKMLWKEMYDFSHNAILLVLASTKYDASEYIRDYDEYLKIVK